jgi:hypothetical protein
LNWETDMRNVQSTLITMILIALPLSGCEREATASPNPSPATLEESGQPGIKRVRLTARAAERLGIETAQVREEAVTIADDSVQRKVIPYGAIIYDTKGQTWTFTNPEPLVFLRQSVIVERIAGNKVVLTEGPPAGTAVVTVGSAELMGAESKYGH